MPTESIEVRYKPIFTDPDSGDKIYHKYIVYTDSNGDEWFARGGPAVGDGYGSRAGDTSSKSILKPFGNIVTEYGQYTDNILTSPDWDDPNDSSVHGSETIATGSDLSTEYLAILDAMDDIKNENHTYNLVGPAGRNSNSAVDTSLSRVSTTNYPDGLPQPTLDDRGEYLSPASGYILSESIQPEPSGTRDDDEYIDDVKEKFGDAEANGSPLILDLSDNGTIDLISLANSEAYWDNNQNGFRSVSGWVDSGDGLLAIDLNEDGVINDNGELFGTVDTDGFTVLGAYDSNADSVIDSQDAVWDDLIIWQDHNENGFSEDGELYSLSDFDIIDFDLNATEVSQTNQGHDVTHTSTFTVDDGVNPPDTRIVHDVWFEYDTVNTVYDQEFTYNEAVLYMPTLRGYGTLPDLSISMSLDDTGTDNLLDQVGSLFLTSFDDLFDDTTDLMDDVTAIMYRWAAVDGVDPDSRGGLIDARELGFLEAMTGQPFLQRGQYSDPYGYEAAGNLQEAFAIAFDNIFARLLAQSAGGELFTGDFYYDIAADEFSGITGLDSSKLSDLETEATGLSTIAEKKIFWGNVVRMVEHSVGTDNLPGGGQTALDDAITASDATLDLDDIITEITFVHPTGVNESGTSGADTMNGSSNNDELSGGYGDDTIDGQAGSDTIFAQGDDDIISGETGNDQYLYELGHGHDVIREPSSGAGEFDEIVFGAGPRREARSERSDTQHVRHLYKAKTNRVVCVANDNRVAANDNGFGALTVPLAA